MSDLSTNGWLNPFRELSPTHLREVRQRRQLAREVARRYERILVAYRELVATPRYKEIRYELELSLGEVLHQLVELSAGCAHCAPTAMKVKALNEIVARPLYQLFLDAQRSRLESQTEADPSE